MKMKLGSNHLNFMGVGGITLGSCLFFTIEWYFKQANCIVLKGPGWLNELGRWIQQLIQAYHQYGMGSHPLCELQKRCTRLAVACDKVYQLLAHGRWFSPGTPASSTTKTGRHDIAEILLKVALKHQKSINHCIVLSNSKL